MSKLNKRITKKKMFKNEKRKRSSNIIFANDFQNELRKTLDKNYKCLTVADTNDCNLIKK